MDTEMEKDEQRRRAAGHKFRTTLPRDLEIEWWLARVEERRAATRDAIDRGEPLATVKRLAFEARSAEMELEEVERYGRPLGRAGRRREGIKTRVPNGYRPPR